MKVVGIATCRVPQESPVSAWWAAVLKILRGTWPDPAVKPTPAVGRNGSVRRRHGQVSHPPGSSLTAVFDVPSPLHA